MQDSGNRCQQFAAYIRDIFENGLRINDRDSHFILSTLPIAHLNEIEKLIRNPDGIEYDALMELIYFPDESSQIRLEDQIEAAQFQAREVETILTHLMAFESETHILSPERQLLMTLPTPRSGARAFLQRLNINRHLDFELIRAIEVCVDPIMASQYKVWIRNMTREPTKRDMRFLRSLFLKLAPQHQRRDQLIEFVLRFLEETQVDMEPLQGLVQYKQRCLRHLQRLGRFKSKRQNHNYETRIALGIREPYDDKQALMQKVVLLDEIGLALFDRSI